MMMIEVVVVVVVKLIKKRMTDRFVQLRRRGKRVKFDRRKVVVGVAEFEIEAVAAFRVARSKGEVVVLVMVLTLVV